MFNLREFIKHGLLEAVGNMADYQIILNAAGWHEKGVLTESDLAEIQASIKSFKKDEKTETVDDTTAPDGEDEPVVEEPVEGDPVVEETMPQ